MSVKRDLIKEFRNFLKNLGVARNDSEPSAETEPAPEPIDKGKQSSSQEQEQNKTKDDLIKSLTAQVATLTDALTEMKKLWLPQ
ncbi:hypothetical protein L9Z17_00010 [Leptospira noguchii]|nr:hypothetical protein [Leptospira noguchii]